MSLAVPGARLFTREMNSAVSRGLRTNRNVKVEKKLREEIEHWLFLKTWDDPLPWRDERHLQITLASDASGSGWGASLRLLEGEKIASDYWNDQEVELDIAVKEALALDKSLNAFAELLRNARVDALVDSMAVVGAWSNQGGRSANLNMAIKRLFFTTLRLNIGLQTTYIRTDINPADHPSRRLSALDSKLSPCLWYIVQREFGGPGGHTCDLMALDSNTMHDKDNRPLPHFTPGPSLQSCGINVFAQELASGARHLGQLYVFPPFSLVGPVIWFLSDQRRDCTLVTELSYPRKYWWPLVLKHSVKSLRLSRNGEQGALLVPSKNGWIDHTGLKGELWAFSLAFE